MVPAVPKSIFCIAPAVGCALAVPAADSTATETTHAQAASLPAAPRH
jgi:hypothetical protein